MEEGSSQSVEAAIQRLCQVLMEPELDDGEHTDDSDENEECSSSSYMEEFRENIQLLEEAFELNGETLKLIALHRDQSDDQLVTLQMLYTELIREANEQANRLYEVREMEQKVTARENYINRFKTVLNQKKQ
ncbi:uncharacterized protein LOC126581067 [Anopheles aquasalis]|uniref:uncharacterized protein LOC126581067 n=1 Tax=Anopheles aquasalis TaxID=42839 RepID=UPI00215B45CB|nr:uncharacterized protein LOC126581067 [Anopheles aquasalis]